MRVFRISLSAALFSALMVVAGACGDGDAGAGQPRSASAFDEQRAFDDLESQVAYGPRPAGSEANRQMTLWLADQLRAAGVSHVKIQRPYRNVVGVIPGRRSGSVVVGAHHDTKDIPGFVGANDGASGVAVVLELARALPDRVRGPSLEIALFDAEEARDDKPFEADGTRGSRQYLHYAKGARQGSPRLDEIRAMVLFDLVGDCDLQIPHEPFSSQGLYARFRSAAKLLGDGDPAPFTGGTTPIEDDHTPFTDRGIPAVDLIDFTFGPGPTPGGWWHSTEDTLDKVCPSSLGAVGAPSLVAIPKIR